MPKNHSIPKNYKQTEIGVIPQDWEVVRLEDVGKVVSGLTYSPIDINQNGTLVLRSSNIQNRTLELKDNVFVDTKNIIFNSVKVNDILICVRNGSKRLIGKNTLINKDNEGVAFGAFMSIFRSQSNTYLFQLFDTNYYKKQVYKNLGATINSINNSDLRKFKIPLPPKPEQQKIADILTTWDNAIEKQTTLITQKQQLKKALMQRLLTGKIRFSGFSDEWKIVKLEEICDIKKGSQINKNTLIASGKYPVINGGIEPSGYNKDFNTGKNTITISEGGNSCGYINYISTKFWSGGHCYSLLNLNINMLFLYQFLKLNQNSIMRLRVGSGLPNIQKGNIEKFKILLPLESEQKKISQVLTCADDEITKSQTALNLLKSQKQGLMQQLLTGKVRVVI